MFQLKKKKKKKSVGKENFGETSRFHFELTSTFSVSLSHHFTCVRYLSLDVSDDFLVLGLFDFFRPFFYSSCL